MAKVQEMKLDNKKEMYDSLVQAFENEVGIGQRKKIVARAKQMLKEMKGRDKITKEYKEVLNQIVKDYSRKQTVEEIQREIDNAKWNKKR